MPTTTPRKRPRKRVIKQKPLPVIEEPQGLHKMGSFQPKGWAVWSGIAVFAFGMMAGIMNGVDGINEQMIYIPLVHQDGKVAGATTDEIVPGFVSIEIQERENPRGYTVDLSDEVSVFNVLQLAAERTSLMTGFSQTSGITAINRVGDRSGEWQVVIDGEPVADIDTAMVRPGMTLVLAEVGVAQ